MQVIRVTEMPVEPVANAIYLVKGDNNELIVNVTGNNAATVAATHTKSTIEGWIASQIGQLDIANGVQFAEDITERDALELTKDSLVFVEDASDDATVDDGAALYYYSKSEDKYVKVSEYESMDLVFPKKDLVGRLDEDASQRLTYRGQVVGGVIEGEHAW